MEWMIETIILILLLGCIFCCGMAVGLMYAEKLDKDDENTNKNAR